MQGESSMPGKNLSGSGTARRLPAAVIFLGVALCLALPRPAPAATACEYIAWLNTGSAATGRAWHTATLLPNGKVLVAGGQDDATDRLASCELYDPATGTWSPTGPLTEGRNSHTATLLPNGKVLVAGGDSNDAGWVASCELYDPANGTWSPADPLTAARRSHTATTLLPNGKVLVAGGLGDMGPVDSCELYDPATGTWSPAGPLTEGRHSHTATLLPNGQVLVAGGVRYSSNLASAELYDPVTGVWTTTSPLLSVRSRHAATLMANGKVLVAGGEGTSGNLYSTEIYDPATVAWANAGNLATARSGHTATLMPNGQVVVAGGYSGDSPVSCTEIYIPDPGFEAWQALGSLNSARTGHTATLLPGGQVLLASGSGVVSQDPYTEANLTSAELYDCALGHWENIEYGLSHLNQAREDHTATLLPNGKVLVAGGVGIITPPYDYGPLSSAEICDPDSMVWTDTGSLIEARSYHTATLLANGKVLVSGGDGSAGLSLGSAELFTPADTTPYGAWAPTGSLSTAREDHTATLLADGRVLVVGGTQFNDVDYVDLTSAEVFDPAADGGLGGWSAAGNRPGEVGFYYHTATLLPSGKVLVVGGEHDWGDYTYLYSDGADLFNPNPADGSWTSTNSLTTPRSSHTATLLPSGKVLVAGGYGGNDESGYDYQTTCELYDPATGIWSPTGDLIYPRGGHRATLLPNGKVLVTGGWGNDVIYSSAELYDPATGVWTETDYMHQGRAGHTATLVPSGKVLAAAGNVYGDPDDTADLYDPGLGFSESWTPLVDPITGTLTPGSSLSLTGSRFRGLSQASGGATNDSPTNYPLVQLRRLDSERVLWLPTASALTLSFTDTTFTSRAFQDFQTGHCLVTVFVNGIPSLSQFTLFQTSSSTAVKLASFTAAWDQKRVVLEWETYTEKDNLGFYLWRKEAGQDAYTRLTRDLISARGSATMGAAYSYGDLFVVRGRAYLYKLEDVDRFGASTFHGPVSATVAAKVGSGAGGRKGKNKQSRNPQWTWGRLRQGCPMNDARLSSP
jgi:large repetitive protein